MSKALEKAGGRPPAMPVEWEAYHTLPSAKQVRLMQEFARAGFDFEQLTDIAKKVGFKGPAIRRQALRALKPFSGNQYLRAALLAQGIDFTKIASKIAEQIDAVNPDGTPDRVSERWATEMAIKAHQAMPATKIEIDKHQTNEFILTDEVQERINRARVIEAEVIKEDALAKTG